MDCQTAQQEIVDRLAGETAAELGAHLAGCSRCSAFLASHADLDRRLSSLFAPPKLSPAFRPALRRSIRTKKTPWLREVVPDVFHFVGWGAVTIACAAVAPLDPALVLATGATAALLTYVLVAAVRTSLDV